MFHIRITSSVVIPVYLIAAFSFRDKAHQLVGAEKIDNGMIKRNVAHIYKYQLPIGYHNITGVIISMNYCIAKRDRINKLIHLSDIVFTEIVTV